MHRLLQDLRFLRKAALLNIGQVHLDLILSLFPHAAQQMRILVDHTHVIRGTPDQMTRHLCVCGCFLCASWARMVLCKVISAVFAAGVGMLIAGVGNVYTGVRK